MKLPLNEKIPSRASDISNVALDPLIEVDEKTELERSGNHEHIKDKTFGELKKWEPCGLR